MIARETYDVYEVTDGEEIHVGRFYNKHILEVVELLRDDITIGELELEEDGSGGYTVYDEGDFVCYRIYLFQ